MPIKIYKWKTQRRNSQKGNKTVKKLKKLRGGQSEPHKCYICHGEISLELKTDHTAGNIPVKLAADQNIYFHTDCIVNCKKSATPLLLNKNKNCNILNGNLNLEFLNSEKEFVSNENEMNILTNLYNSPILDDENISAIHKNLDDIFTQIKKKDIYAETYIQNIAARKQDLIDRTKTNYKPTSFMSKFKFW